MLKIKDMGNIDRHEKPLFQINDRAIVFDADTWNWQDVGDNSQFHKPARVVKIYKERDNDSGEKRRWLADVIFDDNPQKISRGHFQYCMDAIKSNNN
jgi:hypothetical protein